ncbi:MAG: M50 family metallopeptidase [Bacteroidales bacterium]|nr:M50 family metallopeptidase [Bacteroidales bacterium]
MKSERGIKKTLGVIGYVFTCLVLSVLVLIAVGVLVETIKLETRTQARLFLHRNLLLGFITFFLLFIIPRVRSNVRWLMKFNHEFTHLLFALLFFRRIYRFKVDDSDSYVSYSSGWFGYHAITLSPYCVPIFTLALLPWHFTTASHLYLTVIDILIGFSYSFHVCTWVKQIRLSQTDIIGPGRLKSILCIILFQIINFCLITLTPSSGVMLAIQRVFVDFPGKVVALL